MTPTEDGFTTIEWMVGIAMLLVPVAMLVLSFASWSQRVHLAETVAAETARAAVLSPDAVTARGAALQVADAALAAHGVMRRSTCNEDDCAVVTISGSLERGAVVEVVVTVLLPAVAVPFVGDVGAVPWTVRHRERVDDYRSLP